MVKLEAGNCRINGSQRRQLNAWLKRAVHLGERVGDFVLRISIRRIGRAYELVASVHDATGDFGCRSRGQTWRDVCREIARIISVRLRGHRQIALAA
jgi:hypothetical protein